MANATMAPSLPPPPAPPLASPDGPAPASTEAPEAPPARKPQLGEAVTAALSGALSWLKQKAALPKKPASRVEPEGAPEPRPEPRSEVKPRPASAPEADDFEPVPDFVIRPGASLRAQLPALIEPKVDRRMGYILAGAIALLLLAALGILLFHDVLAAQLPVEWRTILHFDTARAVTSHDLASAS
jgi:hypothetical protein